MHFSTAAIFALAGASSVIASAIPGKSTLLERQAVLCSGASSSAVCCATDVLGVADLDCAPRKLTLLGHICYLERQRTDNETAPTTPTSTDDFTEICAAIGQRARCCLLPIVSLNATSLTPSVREMRLTYPAIARTRPHLHCPWQVDYETKATLKLWIA